MNIIFNEDYFPSFSEFGLNIPMANQRFFDVVDHLPSKAKIVKIERGEGDFPNQNDLLRVHSQQYIDGLYNDELPGLINRCFEYLDENGDPRYAKKFPNQENSEKLREHILNKVFQVKKTMESALDSGFAICLGGGMHHARKDFGHGFCLFNDFLISAYSLIHEKRIESVLIIDVDAHLGDGTIDCTYRDDRFWTVDLHMKDGWPNDHENLKLKAEANVHIGLTSGIEDQYLTLLQRSLEETHQRFIKSSSPDIAICLLGADPYEDDELLSTKNLNLSLDQLLKRDQMIYQFLNSLDIPICVLMAGGYGENSWKVTSQFLNWVATQIK